MWTGYFDRAIYSDPISAPGLVLWDTGGNQQWVYQPPPGEVPIADCYALNVTDGVAWAYCYQAFSLLEIHIGGRLTVRDTPVKGAYGSRQTATRSPSSRAGDIVTAYTGVA